MKPYWSSPEHNLSIYCGDCHRLLLHRDTKRAIGDGNVTLVTDPPWPRGTGRELTASVCRVTDEMRVLMNDLSDTLKLEQLRRCVIHLGSDTDPRVLKYIGLRPFLRLCTLEYACPHYKGRLLYDCDVAYVFGEPPASCKGQHLLPRRCVYSAVEPRIEGHPYPRRLAHVEWLVRWFTEPADTVLDPYLGSGTTLLAAYRQGRAAVGMEVEKKYCAVAVERLEKEMAQLRLPEPQEIPQVKQAVLPGTTTCAPEKSVV